MSVNISFFCDVCDDREHVDGFEPSRVVSMYLPTGWGMRNSGHNTPYIVTCPACTRTPPF